MEKSYEFGNALYMCFIDYKKAFNCVNHSQLGNTLRMMGIPEHITILKKNLYEGQEAMTRTQYGVTEWFKVNKGVRQRCILSPFLFNLYREQIMRKAGLEDTGIAVRIGRTVINNLRYADDTTIIAEEPKDLELPMNKIKHTSAKVGLELNLAKTKIMATGKSQILKIDGQDLDIVECYTFLGSTVTKDGVCTKGIRRIIMMGKSAVSKLERILNDKNVTKQTKRKIAETLFSK